VNLPVLEVGIMSLLVFMVLSAVLIPTCRYRVALPSLLTYAVIPAKA